jgi:phospholipase D1/2
MIHSISNTTEGHGPVKNLIAKALVDRILTAARDGAKFKVRHVPFPALVEY